MTTITTATAQPTEIQSAAAEAAEALRRLLQLAREDYTLAGPVEALDALTAADGPLNLLSEQLGELDACLAEFGRDDDGERDGIDDARDVLDIVISNIDDAVTHLGTAADCIRDLV